MRKVIFLTSLVLLVILLIFGVGQRIANPSLDLSICLSVGENVETIHGWKSEDNKYYLFLPSYAEIAHAQFSLGSDAEVYINDTRVTDRMDCSEYQLNTLYVLDYTVFGQRVRSSIVFIQSGDIPTMYIDTQSGSLDYIHREKGNEEEGKFRLYAPDGALEYEGNLNSINGRGNYTWEAFEKKPYSIELSAEADLLGMGSARKWILLANAGDTSNMRNKIVYDFAREIGLAYSPETQWIDLYLNGEYAGVYLLSERNEVHPERVDIPEEGSFLVSLERAERLQEQGYAHVLTEEGQALRIHYPKQITQQRMDEIENIFQSIENAIFDEDGIDPISHKTLSEMLDLESWARKYLMEEVFGNVDGGLISQYFYYDSQVGRVFAGPVWDFDHAVGNKYDAEWYIENPDVFVVNRSFAKAIWFDELYCNEEFYNKILEVYKRDFLPKIDRLLTSDLQSYRQAIEKASMMNGIRWQHSEKDSMPVQFEEIRSYLEGHVKFLSEVWLNGKAYCQVALNTMTIDSNIYFSVLPGQYVMDLPQLKESDVAFLGWYHADTGEPFDPTVPIYSDIELCAKWEDSSSKRMGQIVKLMPLAVIALMGVCLLAVEMRCRKK